MCNCCQPESTKYSYFYFEMGGFGVVESRAGGLDIWVKIFKERHKLFERFPFLHPYRVLNECNEILSIVLFSLRKPTLISANP